MIVNVTVNPKTTEAETTEDADEKSGEDEDASEKGAPKRSKVKLVAPRKKRKPGVIYL